jgi:ABC-type sugar transport system substrate-binding protein
MKKKGLAFLLALSMALSLAACGAPAASGGNAAGGSGSGAAENYRVEYLNRDDTDEFLNVICTSVENLCKADETIEFIRYDAASDSNNQLAQMEDVINKGVDLIVLLCQDKESVVSKVLECHELGIPVIARDISLARGTCDFIYVGSDNYTLAYAEGKYLMEHLPANGKIIYLRFTPGSETSAKRHDGVTKAIEDSGRTDYEILTTMDYRATQEEGMSLMEDLLQVYGENWEALITHNDKGTYGAISAIEAAGYKVEDKLIVSFDGEDIAKQMILDGKMEIGRAHV